MNRMTRRSLIAAIGVAGAGTCVCGLQNGCASFTKVGDTPPVPAEAVSFHPDCLKIDLAKTPQLAEEGGAVKIIDKRLKESLIVARISDTEFAAVSLLCPHRGVEVEYRPHQGDFRCASLGHSRFTAEGEKIKGFAKRDLTRYAAALDGSDSSILVVRYQIENNF